MKNFIKIAIFILVIILPQNGYAGPQKTIMVGNFEVKAGFEALPAIGEPLQDMMTEALVQSGRFIVTERPQLATGLAEQDFANSGRTSAIGRPATGKITNAQYMITGAVTEYDSSASGTGAGLNIQGFSVGGNQTSAHIGVIIRIMDTTTMQVVDSQRVEGRAIARGGSLGYQGGNVGGGLSGFRKTPIGEACQNAINSALSFILARLEQTAPSQFTIAMIEGHDIVINVGGEAGIRPGQQFNVLNTGAEIIDPVTGISLGSRQKIVGIIEIVTVDAKFATARPLGGGPFSVGDILQNK